MALTLGVLALVEAKPGKEAEVEAFVKAGQVDRRAGAGHAGLVWLPRRRLDVRDLRCLRGRGGASGAPVRADPGGAGRGRPAAARQGSRISAWWTSSRSRARRFGGWAPAQPSAGSVPSAGRRQPVVRLGEERQDDVTERRVARVEDRDPELLGVDGVGEEPIEARRSRGRPSIRRGARTSSRPTPMFSRNTPGRPRFEARPRRVRRS